MPTVPFAAVAFLLPLSWMAPSGTDAAHSLLVPVLNEAQSGFAQRPPQAPPIRFAEMDANRDGVIVRDEWRGTADAFRANDWNGDGVLSGEEVRSGAVRSGSPRGTQNGDMRFAEMDGDRDRVITRNEWHGVADDFRVNDWNGDGVLSGEEVRPGAVRPNSSRGGQSDMRFAEMDGDRDRVITRNEWHGVADDFRVNDWNGDGVLSGEEVRNGAIRPGSPRDGQYGRDRNFDLTVPDEFDNWTTAGFSGLDRNRDGRIIRSEWPYDAETFQRIDLNHNGFVTSQEFLSAASGGDDRLVRFDYLDTNGNRRIERNEWNGTASAFNALDRNRDGVLSEAEGVGMSVSGSDLFTTLDTDRNRRISPAEWRGSRRSFDWRDANRDGFLTRREWLAAGDMANGNYGDGANGQGRPLPTSGQNVRVVATQRWTDTGLFVRAGDTVLLDAQGSVRMSENADDIATPAGARSGRLAPDAFFPQEKAGALVARIGNDAPLFIGGQRSIRATTTGQLFLGVNDDHLPDNSGEFRVIVSVQGR